MKSVSIKFGSLIIFLCLCFALTGMSQTKKEASFTVSSGDKLDISISQGNINITTGSGNHVKVLAKNIEEDELKLLTMEQKSGKVEIKFKGEDSDDFELELTIPSEINSDISTGGGNIYVKGDLKGTVDVSTGGGNITVMTINGTADISTGGGNIVTTDINGSADISTGGGEIKVGVLNGVADLSTGGGNIYITSINNSANISTGGGNINVGDVGGKADISTGGGNINMGNVSGDADISTGGGNINLEGAKGKIDVSSGAGNISLKNITGSVDASTGAGDIYAEIYPESNVQSELSSGIGDITLKVPGSAKVTIIARLSVGAWGDSDEVLDQIKSDFSSTEVNKRGDKRLVEVIYKLNGGGPTIKLNAAMGEIEIRKMN